jgi:hypoxanthine phosphoribosyltransferase
MNQLITWTEFYKANRALLTQIQGSGKQYDYILAITRGGVFPAYFLAKALDLPLETINLSSYAEQQAGQIVHTTVEGFTCEVLDPTKCLLVDDIYDSGQTITYLQQQYPGIDAACTYARWPDHSLSYVGEVLNYETWIDFPWEVMWDGETKHSQPL